jgi:AcrR family transcriptional regulator
MADLEPKKWPRQARSRATFDAILEACARLLAEQPLASITTNHIAARAGVSVGSLYEFFPNRESILAVLAQQRLERLREDVAHDLDEAAELGDWEGVRLLVGRIVERVTADRRLFRVLLRDAPFLRERPETQRAIGELFGLSRLAGRRARGRTALRDPAADSWLIGRMLASAVLDIAFHEGRAADRRARADELARLAYRMVMARDPARA